MDESNVTLKVGKSYFSVQVVSASNSFRPVLCVRDNTRHASMCCG